jgi:glycosyltransferase involved in cell wall biosynthesis
VAIQELAIFHPAGHLTQPGNPFGKDIANAGLFRALAQHGGYRQFNVLNQLNVPPQALAAGLFPDGQMRSAVATAPLHSTDVPARGGVLLRGQPYLSELAWLRRSAARQNDYSLVGLIHTIAPPAIRELIGAAAVAPVEGWDALVCSSPAVQEAMGEMFDRWDVYMQERLGAARAPRPQLPLIPLAVDVESMIAVADQDDLGKDLRKTYDIKADDLVVLWVGRLSFFEKAFPQPMFLAVERAARRSGCRVHFLMAGWFPGGEEDRARYLQAAASYAPSVNLLLLDGNDKDVLEACWSAADVFLSLVDNIQETFGLTPVEAMAAGLPLVVSDWDGYSYTVRNEVEGFLIPTLGGSAEQLGTLIANLHSLGLETYQTYVGAVAQHTAVHVEAAAEALERLFLSPALRARLGAAGRRRACELFSWPIVVSQYNDLLEELAERRLVDSLNNAARDGLRHRLHPMRGNPFSDFEGFSTEVLRPETTFCVAEDFALEETLARLQAVSLDGMFPGVRANPQEVETLLRKLQFQPAFSLRQIQQCYPPERAEFIGLALVWLAKLGVVNWA